MILQRDNARSYQNAIVPFFVFVLIIFTGLFVSCYIHTDARAGKGIIYGLFAMMINIVCDYIDVVSNVCTLYHLLCALVYNGGGYNFIA